MARKIEQRQAALCRSNGPLPHAEILCLPPVATGQLRPNSPTPEWFPTGDGIPAMHASQLNPCLQTPGRCFVQLRA
jgi:hypothetical protein